MHNFARVLGFDSSYTIDDAGNPAFALEVFSHFVPALVDRPGEDWRGLDNPIILGDEAGDEMRGNDPDQDHAPISDSVRLGPRYPA